MSVRDPRPISAGVGNCRHLLLVLICHPWKTAMSVEMHTCAVKMGDVGDATFLRGSSCTCISKV